jgi:hypothetical protein
MLTINAFFSGDDFFLLRQSQAGWSLFKKSDFDYYRPLTLLVWFCEYHLWHLQPIFYHLSSLFFHTANSLLVAILINLVTQNRKYGALAACIFCLYPAHPEAVSWLAGKFDVLSTTAQLLSFISLVKAFQTLQVKTTSNKLFASSWLVLSLITYLIALLNKEAAIFLPIVVLSYLILEISIIKGKKFQNLGWVLAVTSLYLGVSILYFIVRLAVLNGASSGDDVNYNYLSFFWGAIAEAYEVLIAPINRALLVNQQAIAVLLLLTCNLLFFVSLMYSFISAFKKKRLRVMLLLTLSLIWSIVAIIPALAVNYIRAGWKSGDLEGSRVLYSASIGICVILAITIIELAEWGQSLYPYLIKARVFLTFSTAILVFYMALLNLNNLTWAKTGKWTAQITQEFSQVLPLALTSGHDLVKASEPGVGVVLIDLPDNYKGAYAAHNMFNIQNNLGQVFYNVKVAAAQIDSATENTLDYSKLDFTTLYILKFATIKDNVELLSVQQLNKGLPSINLLDKTKP